MIRNYNKKCRVCNAEDSAGNYIRDQADSIVASGGSNKEARDFLSSCGVTTTAENFSRHLNNHSKASILARKELKRRKTLLRLDPDDLYIKLMEEKTKRTIKRSKEMEKRINKVHSEAILARAEEEFSINCCAAKAA